ncbi:MAG: hypothetical protein E6Q97_09635 [Desulfurellales bacterium]|nr:MAG: hypothetical protein E6Q97_09635 [Desulfurellales bacterium]
MRETEITLSGQSLRLVADFKASMEISSMVGDPLTIMREATLEAALIQEGIPYEPKWRFTLANVRDILWIGLKNADSKMSKSELEALIFDAGLLAAKEAAAEYLTLIFGPKPEEVSAGSGDSGN